MKLWQSLSIGIKSVTFLFLFNFVEMEPMTLGSPVAGPASPSSPGFTSPYLPEFLMGESTPGVSRM
jgi:hypothetical protein